MSASPTSPVLGTWMNLRYPGRCKACARIVHKGDRGFYLRDEKMVLCPGCAVYEGIASDPDPSRKVDTSGYKSGGSNASATYAPADLELTQEVISFLRLVAAHDGDDVPLEPGATALLKKFKRNTAVVTRDQHTADEMITVALDPIEVVLRCPKCSHLTDPHECKEAVDENLPF